MVLSLLRRRTSEIIIYKVFIFFSISCQNALKKFTRNSFEVTTKIKKKDTFDEKFEIFVTSNEEDHEFPVYLSLIYFI